MYPLWLGPFTVTEKISDVAYRLELPPHFKLNTSFHISLLKPVYDNGTGAPQPAPIFVEGEPEWEVEQILYHEPAHKRRGDKGIRYKVKWLGYAPECNTFEPEHAFKARAKETLQEYWDEVEKHTPPELVSGSGTGLAPSDLPPPPATRSRGAKRPTPETQTRSRKLRRYIPVSS